MDRVDDIYGDGIGYVHLLDSMGDEFTPAEDARTSTNKGRLGPEKDAALQERLTKDAHTSPFEGVVVKVEIMTPLFVLRELDRHRTVSKVADEDVEIITPEESGRKWFARNEMSGRYVQMPNLYYHPVQVRAQSKTNMQGGGPIQLVDDAVAREFKESGQVLCMMARDLYDRAVAAGVEKGIARIYNTQNQYTKIRLTGSLKNFCDFLYLRLPGVVLWECRRVAEALEELLKEAFPSPMEQWRRNIYETVRLTKADRAALVEMMDALGEFGDESLLPAEWQSALAKVRG
jgi:thymidylate synthase (FAD)